MLLGAGADVDQQQNGGYTAVYIACHFGHEKVVDLLLEAGANIALCRGSRHRPLHISVERGRGTLVQKLLDRNADANAKGCNGATPLSLAEKKGYTDIAEMLKAAGATTEVAKSKRPWLDHP